MISRRIISGSIVICILIIIYFFTSFLKVHHFKKLPQYNPKDDTCLFWTESAFQYRYAKMIAEGKKIPSIDYKAQYPEGVKPFSEFTIFMELASGYTYRVFSYFDFKVPFHTFLIYFISFFSSISIIAVYLVTSHLFRSKYIGIFSSLFYAFSPAFSGRTIGNYIYEDFTLPFIFLGFYFYLKSLNYKDKFSLNTYSLICGLCFFISLASWHLTRFYFFIFILYVVINFLFSKKNHPLMKSFFIITLFSFAAGVFIPVLRAKLFVFSYPMIISYCLLFAYFTERYLGFGKKKSAPIFIISTIIISIIVTFLTREEYLQYSHVYSLIFYKILFLGQKPSNPNMLPYEARALWIEAFNSPTLRSIILCFSTTLPLGTFSVISSLRRFVKRETKIEENLLLYFVLVFFGLYLLVDRLDVFFIFYLSVFVGGILSKKQGKYLIICLLILSSCLTFETYKTIHYPKPTFLNRTIDKFMPKEEGKIPGYFSDNMGVVKWIRNNTREDDVILAWFGIGPMVLTDTGRAIVLHSKFESEPLRRKSKEFIFALYNGEAKFYSLCKKYKANYFLYHTRLLLNRSKDSNRYLTNNLTLKKNTVVYKFHFTPEELNNFTPVYQNSFYRLFKIHQKGEIPAISYKLPYQMIFDKRLFEDKATRFLIFNDGRTKDITERIRSSGTHNNLGLTYYNKGEYNKAVIEFSKAIKANPGLVEAYNNLGVVYTRQGKLNRAMNTWEKALKINPVSIEVKWNMDKIRELIENK